MTRSRRSAKTIGGTTELRFFVPGRPAPQGSKRHIGHGVLIESSKALKPWRERCYWHAHQTMRQAQTDMFTTAVGVELEFVLPRPISTPKSYTPYAIKRPDLDKLARACLDAITGIVIADDSQVVSLNSTKRLAQAGETPGDE